MTATPRNLRFQVNTYSTFTQTNPAIAMDPDGNFVVTWSSSGQDGSGYGIYAQRYQDDGQSDATPVGGEFRVNTYTTSTQSRSAIAMDADGNFVVTWQSSGQDGSSFGIFGQRYSSTGGTLGSEFLLNTFTTGLQVRPAIAMAPSGSFVATWTSDGQDGSDYGIYARRYTSAAVAMGNEFQVNIYTLGRQHNSAIAMDRDGNFVVAWQSFAQSSTSNDNDIFARRFNASGSAMSGEFQVNTYTTSSQWEPAVAMSPGGDFVITWNSHGQDGEGFGIFAQRYSATGTPVGGEFQVNTSTAGSQRQPAIAMDRDGDFTIAWETRYSGNIGVFAQRYTSDGNRAGDEIQVATEGFTPSLDRPAIAKATNGDFTIAFAGDSGAGTNNVFMRQYTLNRRIRGTGRNDQLLGTAGDDVIRGRGGNDTLYGRSGNDRLIGGKGDDTLFGGQGKDILRGGGGDDRLLGEGGNDRLLGGNGNDSLDGGGGNDILNGGRGRNTLIGGRGNDTFVLNAKGLAIIRDFEEGNNKIGLPNRVTFRQLELSQQRNNALISLDGNLIAQIDRFNADFLNRQDFVSV
jgi:Ca2+-binding RTX toxin-like protein